MPIKSRLRRRSRTAPKSKKQIKKSGLCLTFLIKYAIIKILYLCIAYLDNAAPKVRRWTIGRIYFHYVDATLRSWPMDCLLSTSQALLHAWVIPCNSSTGTNTEVYINDRIHHRNRHRCWHSVLSYVVHRLCQTAHEWLVSTNYTTEYAAQKSPAKRGMCYFSNLSATLLIFCNSKRYFCFTCGYFSWSTSLKNISSGRTHNDPSSYNFR